MKTLREDIKDILLQYRAMLPPKTSADKAVDSILPLIRARVEAKKAERYPLYGCNDDWDKSREAAFDEVLKLLGTEGKEDA